MYARVTRVKQFLVWSQIAFWVVMTHHCGFESLPAFEFLACAPQAEAVPHQSSDCGDTDACATVESGNYRSEDGQVSAPKAPEFPAAFAPVPLAGQAARASAPTRVPPEAPPPELAPGWRFAFRAALPPRAPSLHS